MKNKKKLSTAILCLLLTIVFAAGGTLAYIYVSTAAVQNTFTPPSPSASIPEEIDNGVKKNVAVTNTGDYSAYIRAKVVVTWENSSTDDGDVYAKAPVLGTDYSMELNLGTAGTANSWFLGADGFYYYTSPVQAGNTTALLIKEAAQLKDAPEKGYTLHIEIIAQTIQAEGTTEAGEAAVVDAWKVTLSGTTITGPRAPTV